MISVSKRDPSLLTNVSSASLAFVRGSIGDLWFPLIHLSDTYSCFTTGQCILWVNGIAGNLRIKKSFWHNFLHALPSSLHLKYFSIVQNYWWKCLPRNCWDVKTVNFWLIFCSLITVSFHVKGYAYMVSGIFYVTTSIWPTHAWWCISQLCHHWFKKWPVACSAPNHYVNPRWRHQMEAFSALLALCAENSPVPGEFPEQRPVTRSFDVFFDLRLIKRLSKHSRGWWFETLSCPLWRHCNAVLIGC